MIRFEKELQQKELRHEMKLRLSRMSSHHGPSSYQKPQIIVGDVMPAGATSKTTILLTPSPMTPNSLDELLPAVDESQEVKPELY